MTSHRLIAGSGLSARGMGKGERWAAGPFPFSRVPFPRTGVEVVVQTFPLSRVPFPREGVEVVVWTFPLSPFPFPVER